MSRGGCQSRSASLISSRIFYCDLFLTFWDRMKIFDWSVGCFSFLMFFTDLLFRCEMEKQVLGKVNGDFTNRDCESHNSQVTLMIKVMPHISSLTVRSLNHLSRQVIWLIFRNPQWWNITDAAIHCTLNLKKNPKNSDTENCDGMIIQTRILTEAHLTSHREPSSFTFLSTNM